MDVCRGEVKYAFTATQRIDPRVVMRFGAKGPSDSRRHRRGTRIFLMSTPRTGWFTLGLFVTAGLLTAQVASADTILTGPTTKPVAAASNNKTAPTPVSIPAPALPPANNAKKPLRVLFIGNSYTFFNGGLGTAVKGLASAVKD